MTWRDVLAAFALAGWLVAGVLGVANHKQAGDLALSQQAVKNLRGERDACLVAIARQNQAVAELQAMGKAQESRLMNHQRRSEAIRSETGARVRGILADPVPQENVIVWQADQAARLASAWELGGRP